MELTRKTFQFAAYALRTFENGSPEEKKDVFAHLGYNQQIKDKKLSIEAKEWLVPIEKSYPELEAEFRRLELDKTLTIQVRNEALASLRTRWGQDRYAFLTVLCDHEYMRGIQEKIRLIRAFIETGRQPV